LGFPSCNRTTDPLELHRNLLTTISGGLEKLIFTQFKA
jgi:hypothetical protein